LPRKNDFRHISWGRAVGWTVFGTVVPGVGLLRARRWVSGGVLLGLVVASLGVFAYLLASGQLLTFLTRAEVMRSISLACVVLAAVLTTVAVTTYWSLAPRRLKARQRWLASLTIFVVTFAVTAPALVLAQYAVSSAEVFSQVFADDESDSATVTKFEPATTGDPWADKARLNILLLGYDRGIGRTEDEGGLTDTVMAISVDTASGNTVIMSLPRATAKMPFPKDSPLAEEFPDGWYNGYDEENADYFLNAMYHLLPTLVPHDILGPTKSLGADALKQSVGEALGLTMDYYLLVNIDGAAQLVDAIGGIYVNINKTLPKEPSFLGEFEPGPNQLLNGDDALQYARSRHADDDFHRMGRQRCVINAVLEQADPVTLLTRFESIAAASADMIRTDIPATLLPALMQLGLKVKTQGAVTGMGFVDGEDGFTMMSPDFDVMRQRAKLAIAQSVATLPTNTGQTASSSAAATDSLASSASPAFSSAAPTTADYPGGAPTETAAPDSLSSTQNLDDFCAYHPEE
jgi:LCP family protein required for cell wall assembly